MSDDYATRLARLAAAQNAEPAVIAAAQKAHEKEQRERKAWHTKHGQRLISGRRAVLATRVEQLERQLDSMRAEWDSLKAELAKGRLSTEDYRKRARALMEAREALPDEIERVVADLEQATNGLDPIEASRDFYNRFPSLRRRIGGSIPDFPESSNGHSD